MLHIHSCPYFGMSKKRSPVCFFLFELLNSFPPIFTHIQILFDSQNASFLCVCVLLFLTNFMKFEVTFWVYFGHTLLIKAN